MKIKTVSKILTIGHSIMEFLKGGEIKMGGESLVLKARLTIAFTASTITQPGNDTSLKTLF